MALGIQGFEIATFPQGAGDISSLSQITNFKFPGLGRGGRVTVATFVNTQRQTLLKTLSFPSNSPRKHFKLTQKKCLCHEV